MFHLKKKKKHLATTVLLTMIKHGGRSGDFRLDMSVAELTNESNLQAAQLSVNNSKTHQRGLQTMRHRVTDIKQAKYLDLLT